MSTYRYTREFPAEELNGLTAEMRQAARQVADSVYEACNQPEELLPPLRRAVSASAVLEHGAVLAQDLGYLLPPVRIRLAADIAAVRKLLMAAIESIQAGAD